MSIAAIPSVPTLPALPSISPLSSNPATPASGTDSFSNLIGNGVNALQQAQNNASSAEAQAAAGQGNLADTMIAASKASLDTQVTTDLLDKAITSYNSIMQMSF